MYFIKYQILLHIVGVVLGGTPPSPADESLHQYVEDGSTYSSICDPHGILWYILLGPHHD